ncbi:aryl-sulfate sulfotransferase [Haloglomus litoreum]|uniref:aryl-sulfate sulfotransferase n=1 Tax=Haloglomus litoreum TaxID=3034026 RepID=UPI0023E88143|nr:aryl-sulfate sulfotransferase [Haloglomus sp. DT116]
MASVPERLRARLAGARRRLVESRAWRARAVLLVVLLLLLSPTVVSAATDQGTRLGPGTVDSPAENTTYVSIQGFHFKGVGNAKKPARVVAADGDADARVLVSGVDNDLPFRARWFYDTDPLPNGDLLVTSTNPDGTVVFRYDPDASEVVWYEQFDFHDTHDADLINGDQLLIANMRAYEDGVSNDRILVYDRGNDTVVWDWTFNEHYPNSTDGGFNPDWTHVNDVDKVGDGRYLASPRNFDQVILVNRSTDEIEYQLGSDGNHSRLFEQHNPDFWVDEQGDPTVLVADSENDRVVEFTYEDGRWQEVWSVGGFNWPRDADRLPNGNTLVTDSLNHRAVEITPEGEVVWEVYAAWAPYDAERGAPGSNGPSMTAMDAGGSHEVRGGAGEGPASQETFPDWLRRSTDGTPLAAFGEEVADRYQHVTPFLRPVWMSSWALLGVFLSIPLLLGWGVGEVIYQRRRIVEAIRGLVGGAGGSGEGV